MFSLPLHACLLLLPPAIATVSALEIESSSSPLSITIAFCYAIYLGGLAVAVVCYRLSPLHPLHRYPGPFWYWTSMFWHAAYTTTGRQVMHLKYLHDTYGSVVRIGPNAVSIRDASLVAYLLGPSGIPKGPYYKGTVLSEDDVHLTGIQDVDEHTRRRRPWNRALAPVAIKKYEQVIARRVVQLVQRLEEQKGRAVVLGEWFNYFAYDFMIDMAFGGRSELMNEGDKDNIWVVLEKAMAVAFFLGQVPWLGIYLGYVPGIADSLNGMLAHGRKEVERRIARGSTTHDIFHYLNNDDLPGEEHPPARQLVNDGILAIVAGSDTSSSALTSAFSCLLAHPAAYRALQEEVDRFYPQGEDVCDPKHHRDMHYLTAVIFEAMRLFPPVPTNGPRLVPHSSDPVVFDSIVLPPGTYVYMPPYVLHRDARNFVCPDTFWPERWLVASGHLSLTSARPPSATNARSDTRFDHDFDFVHNEAAFIPFSQGPMNCPGKGLAMLEMRTVICALVQRFRIRAREGWDPRSYEADFKEWLVTNRPEVPVLFEPRW